MKFTPLRLSPSLRIAIAIMIGVIMFATISISSRFREPPGIGWISLLWLFIEYLTFEAIIRFQNFCQNRKIHPKESIQMILVFLGSVLVGTMFYLLLFYIMKWVDHWTYGSEVPMLQHMVLSSLTGLMSSVIFSLIQLAVNWKNDHYQSNLENEQFQRQIMKANLAILKNQLDPHFMFNSFNTLYYLIDENSDVAKRFLKNVSTIYRYILQNNDKALISVAEEYNLGQQYLAIMQQRYTSFLIIEDGITLEELQGKSVPPLVLQQLIENAIKHNRIDESSPLNILFSTENNYIIVRNNINPKRKENTDQTGLSNIKKRYEYLTNRLVIIDHGAKHFTVSLPLIKTPSDD